MTMNTDELPAIFSVAYPIRDKYEAIDEWLEIITRKGMQYGTNTDNYVECGQSR